MAGGSDALVVREEVNENRRYDGNGSLNLLRGVKPPKCGNSYNGTANSGDGFPCIGESQCSSLNNGGSGEGQSRQR